MQGGVPEPSLRSASLGPVCGRPVVDWRIFGGSGAPDQQWPWQASLQFHGKHICGAALIDNFWVISAAHCFQQSYDARDYLVLLGYHELHGAAPHGLQAAVHRLIIHKAFNKDHFLSNDLALLQLRRPVDFTPHILPICLPEPDTMLPIYATCWVTGWGKLTENGPGLPSTLTMMMMMMTCQSHPRLLAPEPCAATEETGPDPWEPTRRPAAQQMLPDAGHLLLAMPPGHTWHLGAAPCCTLAGPRCPASALCAPRAAA
ncbi:hypothetical protein HJG60_008523 [Phyllostomus discolor]|uniref:Peptidase S1 domain-containing protein n=1 Tax=Phyllostomus discolor TaxID=89673 RepID=A0A833Z1F4_9CHIR|nr:hypothetical protein HJG60_008523 [Phyllostomus discolor]